jgi:hypothetical protein
VDVEAGTAGEPVPDLGGLAGAVVVADAASQQTATWAAGVGMNLQSSTLINNESDKPFHLQQAEQIQAFRDAWQQAGHEREPRVSVSRSIFALVDDRDRAYFGRQNQDTDQIGFIDAKTRSFRSPMARTWPRGENARLRTPPLSPRRANCCPLSVFQISTFPRNLRLR